LKGINGVVGEVAVNCGVLAYELGVIARLPPFSPIFSKIGEVQPKVDFSQKSIFRRDSTPKSQNLATPLLQKYIIKLIINK
jgi:hypothetical protein